jgi:hypothetical protein
MKLEGMAFLKYMQLVVLGGVKLIVLATGNEVRGIKSGRKR